MDFWFEEGALRHERSHGVDPSLEEPVVWVEWGKNGGRIVVKLGGWMVEWW